VRRFLKAVKHRVGQIPVVRRICWPEPRRSWLRTAMYRAIDERLEPIAPVSDVVEISGGAFSGLPWRSYDRLTFPDFDLCAPGPHGQYDVVICDQVLEHVVDPVTAMRTLFALCRPGGLAVTMTPFLYFVHEAPGDYWRFTPDGLALLFEHAGFEEVTVGSWGNRAAVAGHLFASIIVDLPWLPRRNRDNYPIQVWGFGRRAAPAA
jgi:SAM-dependent methyltransferase